MLYCYRFYVASPGEVDNPLARAVHRFTSCAVPVEFPGGISFTPTEIKHGRVDDSADKARATLPVELSLTSSFAQALAPLLDDVALSVEVFAFRESDATLSGGVLQLASTPAVFFRGYLAGHELTSLTVQLEMRHVLASLSRQLQVRTYSTQCPFFIYSTQCGAGDFAADDGLITYVDTSLLSASGLVVSSPDFSAKPDGWFKGGILQFEQAVPALGITLKYEAPIVAHAGSQLTLLRAIRPLTTGSTVRARRGCSKSLETCVAGPARFGGCLYVPNQNPSEKIFV